jgi:hypothetical protein
MDEHVYRVVRTKMAYIVIMFSKHYKTGVVSLIWLKNSNLVADFLELALQFGMILMFACAFPPAFAFAAVV